MSWHGRPRHEPPHAPANQLASPISTSFASSARPKLRSNSRSSSDELVRARHRKNANYVFSTAPPCSPLPVPPLSRADWVLVRAHWPFPPPPAMTGSRRSWSSTRPTTTEAFSSSSLCLGITVATPCSSYRARLRQPWLAVAGISRQSSAVPPSPATRHLR